MRGETGGINRRRRDQQLQVGPAWQKPLQVAEQEIDIEAALVRFVNDDGVVFRQPAIRLDLRQQDAVGHELDRCRIADGIIEAHLEADQPAQLHLQFFGNPACHRARGDPSRLGAADHSRSATAGLKTQLGQLGGLAGAGFARDHHHLVFADQFDDVVRGGRDWQAGIHDCGRQCGRTAFALGDRRLQLQRESIAQRGVFRLGLPFRPQAQQPPTVSAQRAIDVAAGLC